MSAARTQPPERTSRRFPRRGMRVGLRVGLLLWCVVAAGIAGMIVRVGGQEPVATESRERFGFESETRDVRFPGAAPLKTDRRLSQALKQAQTLAETGRHDEAVALWQRVLANSYDAILPAETTASTGSGKVYRRFEILGRQVERTLRELPEEGFAAYRLIVDGEARGMLLRGVRKRDERILGEVVQRFFLSSSGDDAAFHLAVLRADQGEFVEASRLLRKILSEYPDTDLPQERILVRLAILDAKLGDPSALDRLKEQSDTGLPQVAAAVVERSLANAAEAAETSAEGEASWRTALGNAARRGVMRPLSGSLLPEGLTEVWADEFALKLSKTVTVRTRGGQRVSRQTPSMEVMVEKWKSHHWMPTRRLLFDGGRVFYLNEDRLVCRELESGKLVWMGRRHKFDLDAVSEFYQAVGLSARDHGRPVSDAEVQLFGDRVAGAMSISHGKLYCVEGSPVSLNESPASARRRLINRRIRSRMSPHRQRENRLAAYEATTGRLVWSREVVETGGASGSSERSGFLAAPTAYRDSLLVPVTDGGEVWLYSLEAATGTTRWKRYLCDDPPGGASPWAPVGVSVQGADAYVSTGTGLTFALDAAGGQVHWAVRHRRSGTSHRISRVTRVRGALSLSPEGWDQDVAIPDGNRLIVFASDYNQIIALDRRDGRLLWEAAQKPSDETAAADYCLGLSGGGLFVAGRNVVRRYDAATGNLLWETETDPAYARGLLTPRGIYLPTSDSVILLDPDDGALLAEAALVSPSGTPRPVGNLYSDGRRLMLAGMDQVAVLADLKDLLAELEAEIAAGDGRAHLKRMRIHARLDRPEAAVEDLIAGFRILRDEASDTEARDVLYDGLRSLGLAEWDPRLTLQLIAESEKPAESQSAREGEAPAEPAPQERRPPLEKSRASDAEVPRELVRERDRLLYAALVAARKDQPPEVIEPLLQTVAAVDDPYLLTAAGRTIAELAGPEDAEAIQAALENGAAKMRLAAIAGLASALGEESEEKLAGLFDDESERVRLAAAREAAARGDRRALAVLAGLLKSDDDRIRANSAEYLQAVTGQRFGFTSYDPPQDRAKAIDAWKQWVETDGQTAALQLPIDPTSGWVGALRGRTLICYYTGNKVIELDSDGKITWEQTIVYPTACQGLPNGHRLVASYQRNAVLEYDETGKEVWKLDRLPKDPCLFVNLPFLGAQIVWRKLDDLPKHPYSIQRLSNGNTLIAFDSARKVIEFNPDGSIAWQMNVGGTATDAQRLENGNTLIAIYSANKVIEVDSGKNIVWEVEGLNRPYSVERLDNGNTLVSLRYAGEVVEIDRQGDVVWSRDGLYRPYDAQRLPGGNTLIVSMGAVREVDREGKVIWERKSNRQPRRAHRY